MALVSDGMVSLPRSQTESTVTKLNITYLIAAVLFGLTMDSANAKLLWTQISDVAPFSTEPAEFVERQMSDVFTDLRDVAPRSGSYFDTLSDSAP